MCRFVQWTLQSASDVSFYNLLKLSLSVTYHAPIHVVFSASGMQAADQPAMTTVGTYPYNKSLAQKHIACLLLPVTCVQFW